MTNIKDKVTNCPKCKVPLVKITRFKCKCCGQMFSTVESVKAQEKYLRENGD